MPTFSEVTIEFLRDFDEDFTLSLTVVDNNVPTSNTWTWKNPRTTNFEVSTGTATGNLGERSAINFKSAYDLDEPTGYVTTRTVNDLLIQSETSTETFAVVNCTDDDGADLIQGVDYNVTYNNYSAPFDVTAVTSSLARSPYYINTPFYSSTTTGVTVALKIWDGDATSVPASNTQTITVTRPTVDFAEFNTNISATLRNYLESKIQLGGSNFAYLNASYTDEVKWVQYTATYNDSSSSVTEIEGFYASVDGYSEYLDGVNKALPNSYLTSATRRTVSDNQYILLPIINNGTYNFVSVSSQPSGTTNNFVPSTSNLSTEYVLYVQINTAQAGANDKYVEVTLTKTAGGTDVIRYDITDECRYTPKVVFFKNKDGFYDCLTMFKKSIETLNVKKSKFINNYVTAGTYDTEKHQIQSINLMGNEKIVCNSGYIRDEENELYKEMLLSEYVWFLEGRDFIPVRPTTSNLTYKTRINDSLVEYQIEFEYAYNTINNV